MGQQWLLLMGANLRMLSFVKQVAFVVHALNHLCSIFLFPRWCICFTRMYDLHVFPFVVGFSSESHLKPPIRKACKFEELAE